MNNGRVTKSRGLLLLAGGAAVLVAVACAWVYGGNAYAARREREAAQALWKTFGPRAALESKYVSGETNAEARRAEALANAVGYDLSPKARGSRDVNGGGEFSEKERAAIGDYVTAQLVRGDDSVSPPSPELAAILKKRRVPLTDLRRNSLVRSLSTLGVPSERHAGERADAEPPRSHADAAPSRRRRARVRRPRRLRRGRDGRSKRRGS